MSFLGATGDSGAASASKRPAEAVKEGLDEEHSDDEARDEAKFVDAGDEQKHDERDDQDKGDAVINADDAAVATIVGGDPVDASLIGHKESDGELHKPLHTEADQ
jgi:hypothetical protein